MHLFEQSAEKESWEKKEEHPLFANIAAHDGETLGGDRRPLLPLGFFLSRNAFFLTADFVSRRAAERKVGE